MSVWDKLERRDFLEYKGEMDAKLSTFDARFVQLENALQEKTPELVEEVRAAQERVTGHEAKVRQSADEVESVLSVLKDEQADVKSELQALRKEVAEVTGLNTALKANVGEAQQFHAELMSSKAKAQGDLAEIVSSVQRAKETLASAEGTATQIETVGRLRSECEGLRENIQGLVDHSIQKKAQIDEVSNEILGQDVKDSEGTVERIEGLRDKIKNSFDRVDTALNAITERASKEVTSVTDQLKALMPGAMAAGLSAAYEAKADSEIASLRRLERHFVVAISGLVAISFIPFGVDVYLLALGRDLIEVLKQTPVLQIIPLYFPVLWFAYATSKKVNLSKRLIEEYTHKSVLGKTFSGLSNQIESLRENEVRQDLRTRLLYNVLQVSAENPGKLITDYNKADHPVMEVLENSSKLSDSLDALSRMPGLNLVAKRLIDRNSSLLSDQAAKVDAGLKAAETLKSSG